MFLKLDLHIHSCFSLDAQNSIEEIVKRAKKIGLDGIAITDHDTINGAIAAKKYVEENSIDLVIIPGVEVTTSKGHIIVLGILEEITKKLSPKETIKKAKELGGIVIVPHPFHPFRHGVGDFGNLDVDAVEVFNSRYITGYSNKKADKIAKINGYPAVAGSDAHMVEAIGFGVTKVDAKPELNSILDGIKKGRTKLTRHKTPLSIYLYQVSNGFLERF